jgi:hypothetical protein
VIALDTHNTAYVPDIDPQTATVARMMPGLVKKT